jgi:hypothetical protein
MIRPAVASYQHTFGLSEHDRAFEQSHPDVALFRQIQQVSTGWRVDRCEQTLLPFDSVLLPQYRWPQWDSVPLVSFEHAAMARAEQLIGQGHQIYILWSGGIDSTVALSAFLRLNKDLDRITVVCSPDAVRENPNFYYDHIRGTLAIISTELFMQQYRQGMITAMVVNGAQGDSVVGHDFQHEMFTLFGAEFLNKAADRTNITQFFRAMGMTDQASDCWYDLIIASAATSPRPIITAFDFAWWFSFNWRWQWAAETFAIRFAHCPNYQPFFGSAAIQQWSVNQTQPVITNAASFKPEFKQFILDYTGDQQYFDRKLKHNSISLYFAGDAYAAIMQDGSRRTSQDFSIFEHYQPNNFINQWLSA